MDRKEAGKKGGNETAQRHGHPHMAEIGKKGFATTVARHWQGDKDGYLKHQRDRAWEKVVGGFVDRLLKEQLDAGQEIASVEFPVVMEPDKDSSFSWTGRTSRRRGRARGV